MGMYGGRMKEPEFLSRPPLERCESPKDKPVVDQKYIDIKEWERKYNKWLMDEGEKPGAHPVTDHDWNTNPEQFRFNDQKTLEEAAREEARKDNNANNSI